MKIVVLDGYVVNPGDLNWNIIKALGEVRVYDRTPDDLIIERSKDAAIVLTNKCILDKKTLEQLPNLKYIGVIATGYFIGVHNIKLQKER